MSDNRVSLNEGNGGEEMQSLLADFLGDFYRGDKWKNQDNDGATFKLPNGDYLCFTTDSFVVNPIEFPGGNIGHLAVCGTINDLAVMGVKPIGISLGLIIEEGFDKDILKRILDSINNVAKEFDVPVVTGDTKVVEKGSCDKIMINVSGVGLGDKILEEKLCVGDKIIVSGGIGEHGVALLSERFEFETDIVSDSKALVDEMKSIVGLVKQVKDPTRGGISSALNEFAQRENVEVAIDESCIPVKSQVKVACDLLGVDVFELANEGRLVCVVSAEKTQEVLAELKKFNVMASVVGEVKNSGLKKGRVILNTEFGSRILEVPSGKIVPRIC